MGPAAGELSVSSENDKCEEVAEQTPEQEVTTETSELETLRAALATADQQAAEQREAMLRMHAEMENLRKRLMRDLERSRKRALEGVMKDLLPVQDSLEKGLQAAAGEDASIESLREGKALIHRMLDKLLQEHGVQLIDPVGEAFNPELHEAMSLIPSPEHPRDTVIDVIQKGYQLNERLIRPARVIVSAGSGE